MHHLTADQPDQPDRPAPRSRMSWLRALPQLARPITKTMPWATLLAGCLAGTGYLAAMTDMTNMTNMAGTQPLGPGDVRLAFLPAVAALAFVPRVPFPPLARTTPVPAWISAAGHLLLAAPILAMTCWVQLRMMAHAIGSHIVGPPPATYPLIAQLTGWCAVTIAAAVCADRSRYADLGGAIAAAVSFAAIALAWYAPLTSRFLTEPAATPHAATIAWYAIATAASALTCAALRDRWHRYAHSFSRRSYQGQDPS